jgi:rhamnosyl/mannosyltransferase
MKILNVTKQFEESNFGGVEKLLDDLCLQFNKKKIIYHIYTIKKKKIKKRNYKIFSDKIFFEFYSCPISLSSILNFRKIAKNYDLINFHFPWPFMDLLSFFVPKKKIIVTYHADITNHNIFYYLYFCMMMLFLLRARKIIVTSKNYFNSSKVLKYFKKKIVIIPIGIKRKIKLVGINKYIQNFKDKKFFIFIGNLRKYKGIDFLVNAFKDLNINFVIVGDGKEKERLRNLIRYCKNIFLFSGLDEDNKIFLLRNSQALLLTSIDRREAYGITLVEALSEKIPIISTKLQTGTSYINKNNVTGYEIKSLNVESIKYSIKKFNKSKSLIRRFKKNSFKRYLKNFSQSKMLKKYIQLYKNILYPNR